MKRAISFSMCVIVMIVFWGGCSKNGNNEEKQKLLQTKRSYALYFRFLDWPDSKDIVKGKYDDIVFVYSEEESEGYPDNVFVTWPTENTEMILINYNLYINYREMDITPFSLTYPIPLKDIVEKWEAVNDFLDSVDFSARMTLSNTFLVSKEEYEEWKAKEGFIST